MAMIEKAQREAGHKDQPDLGEDVGRIRGRRKAKTPLCGRASVTALFERLR